MVRLRQFLQRLWGEPEPRAAPKPPQAEAERRALPAPEAQPVPLKRVFPDLPPDDRELGAATPNRFTQDDIAAALELLRGGQTVKRRVTRPARFQIALRHAQGFARDCLAIDATARISTKEMYSGYLVWAEDAGADPVTPSDFDFAMADFMATKNGIRTMRGYSGCRFRTDFLRRWQDARAVEVRRRLGTGLEELMTGGQRE